MSWKCFSFAEDSLLVEALTERIIRQLRQGIQQRSQATLILSGGRTPERLLGKLAGGELDWSRVTVSLVDERWVPPTHPDSNAAMIARCLLQGPASAASFVPLFNHAADPYTAAPALNARLRQMPLPADVVVMGMGEDGHTASWFPQADNLALALQPPEGMLCCGISAPAAKHPRLTLTLVPVLAARLLILHVVGERKREVLQQAMGEGPAEQLPVRAILHHDGNPTYIYFAEQP